METLLDELFKVGFRAHYEITIGVVRVIDCTLSLETVGAREALDIT